MIVKSGCLVNSQAAHESKAGAVCKTEILIAVLKEKRPCCFFIIGVQAYQSTDLALP